MEDVLKIDENNIYQVGDYVQVRQDVKRGWDPSGHIDAGAFLNFTELRHSRRLGR